MFMVRGMYEYVPREGCQVPYDLTHLSSPLFFDFHALTLSRTSLPPTIMKLTYKSSTRTSLRAKESNDRKSTMAPDDQQRTFDAPPSYADTQSKSAFLVSSNNRQDTDAVSLAPT